jgi:HSP20 family protein
VYPPVNVYNDGESYVVRAEVPGIDPADVDLEVTGDTLTLRGERKRPEVPEGAAYHRRERDFGRFRRSLSLPAQVDSTKVSATCTDGILEIRLPHAESAKRRRIDVKASEV